MKFIISNLIILMTFFGCGSSSDKDFIEVINQEESQTQVTKNHEVIEDEEDNYQDDDYTDDEKPKEKPQVLYSGPFKNIKNIISRSQNDELEDVVYICYGDSTRSYSHYKNQYIFEDIKDTLSRYNVRAINASVTGIKAQEAVSSNNWSNVVDMIPSDGRNTILDLSLGINDYGDYSNSQIKSSLRTIISSIKRKKPRTNFILTVPNRVYYNKYGMTDDLTQIYKDLSDEFNEPYIDVPSEAMPTDEISLDWYVEGDQTHLKRSGQDRIAQLILSKILP